MTIGTEQFWNRLLAFMDEGNVLPVVGQGVTTIAPDDSLLAPWLAAKLADSLNIIREKLPAEPTVHDVVCRYLIDGGDRDDVHVALSDILRTPPQPGPT